MLIFKGLRYLFILIGFFRDAKSVTPYLLASMIDQIDQVIHFIVQVFSAGTFQYNGYIRIARRILGKKHKAIACRIGGSRLSADYHNPFGTFMIAV